MILETHIYIQTLKNKKTQSLQIKELATVCTNTKTFLLLSLCIVETQDARKDSITFSFHEPHAQQQDTSFERHFIKTTENKHSEAAYNETKPEPNTLST